jgi:hypothetical protein
MAMDQDRMAIDHVVVRGRRLDLGSHVHPKLFDREYVNGLRRSLREAQPFSHLVLDDWFNPVLLELVAEEFDMLDESHWKLVRGDHELTRRSVAHCRLGPASEIYFGIVNSGWFMEWVSSITGIPYLLSDPQLYGGGLHESRTGAAFAIHRDFNRHSNSGLKNEMVFITYLNKGWQPEWGSALELWDKKQKACVTRVQPEFGRSIFMLHGPASFHGHPTPLNAPDDRPRRSVAAYYYSSPEAGKPSRDKLNTIFMNRHPVDRVLAVARVCTPPIIWSAIKKVTGR